MIAKVQLYIQYRIYCKLKTSFLIKNGNNMHFLTHANLGSILRY